MNNPINLQGIWETASRVKLSGGVVGNICKLTIFAVIAFASIACVTRESWVSAMALGLLFILLLVVFYGLVKFANDNPQAAILEGAEFVRFEELRLGTKANPQLPVDVDDTIEVTPVALSEEEKETVNKPDLDPPQLPEVVAGGKEVKCG